MTYRIAAGILITPPWDVRRKAKEHYPDSISMQRKWVRARYRLCPPDPLVDISSSVTREPDTFARQSHIQQGTQFVLSESVRQFTKKKAA